MNLSVFTEVKSPSGPISNLTDLAAREIAFSSLFFSVFFLYRALIDGSARNVLSVLSFLAARLVS